MWTLCTVTVRYSSGDLYSVIPLFAPSTVFAINDFDLGLSHRLQLKTAWTAWIKYKVVWFLHFQKALFLAGALLKKKHESELYFWMNVKDIIIRQFEVHAIKGFKADRKSATTRDNCSFTIDDQLMIMRWSACASAIGMRNLNFL